LWTALDFRIILKASMKNREKLHLGAKPAPGDLAFVQGYVNYISWVRQKTDINQPEAVKTWLVRHGLLSPSAPLGGRETQTAFLLCESLRSLLGTNSGAPIDPDAIRRLNRLVKRCRLAVIFGSDGTAVLHSSARGAEKALGRILAEVINATMDGNWQRLKICNNQNCRWVFFDGSKNRSGRWCSMAVCGARAKASSYRKRQRHQM